MKYILKQLKRNVTSNALFCLLLAMVGTLLCLSIGLWYSAHRAILDIDDTITTIAMPDALSVRRFAQYNNITETEVRQSIIDNIYGSELLEFDNRRLYNAFAEGITPIPLRAVGLGFDAAVAPFLPQAYAVVVATFDVTIFDYIPYLRLNEEDGTVSEVVQQVRQAMFSVNEVLYLHYDNPPPVRINVNFPLSYDGSIPFELGQQYILMGHFAPGGGFPRGFSSLTIALPNVPLSQIVVDYVEDESEHSSLIGGHMWWWQLSPAASFPMEIVDIAFESEPTPDDDEPGFIEITGSLEDAFATERWGALQELLESIEISANSFQVLTTNNANSFIRLNQNRHLVYDGRLISAEEYRTGARVALVSHHFAYHNDLSVGDTLALELYAAVFGAVEIEYTPGHYAADVSATAWIPSSYHPNLEITEPIEFTIVGLLNTLLFDRADYAIPRNTIIIPDNSFAGIGGVPMVDSALDVPEHVPLLDEGMIVANGHIEETRAIIDSISYGYSVLFRFFDQGYASVMSALGNLRFGMSWILVLVVAVWIAVVFLFSMFYTAKKRKEASILCALGVSRKTRFAWVFVQSAILIVFSLGISIAVSMPLFGNILDMAAELTEAFTDAFRDLTLSDAADAGLRARIPLVNSPPVMIKTAAGAALLTLIVTGIMSARVSVFKSLAAGKEEG